MVARKVHLRLTPNLWVGAAPFLLFLIPLIRGRTVFWGLPYLQFIPWRHYAWTLLRQGIFPLWNPLNGMGAPLLANYQLALFYPPALPLFLLDEVFGAAGLAWGYTLLIPLHLAFAGLGMVRLMRQLEMRQRSQIVAGLAFALGGFLVARGSFFSIIWAAAWIPWILVGIEQLLTSRKALSYMKSGFRLAICIALMLLAGHAQVSWYAILFAGLWAAVRGLHIGKWKKTILAIGSLTACGVVAIGLTAAQLLPTYEYLTQSQRAAAYDANTAMVYSFSPGRLIGYLIPDFFGNPGYGDFVGYATYWEDAVYIGIIPFFLAVTTVVYLFQKKRSRRFQYLTIFLWAITAVGVVLALGSNTPIFPWLYQNIPTFVMFQAPARWMIWPTIGFSVLAGIGAEQWIQPGPRSKLFLNLASFGGLVSAVLAGLGGLLLPGLETGMVRGLIIFGIMVAAGSFIARRIPAVRPGWWGYAAGVFLVADLIIAQFALNPTVPASIFNASYSQIEQLNNLRKNGRVWIDSGLDYKIKYGYLFNFFDYQPNRDWTRLNEYLTADVNLVDNLPLVNNFDPLLPGRYSTWLNELSDLQPKIQKGWLELAGASVSMAADVSDTSRMQLTSLNPTSRFTWSSCAIRADTGEQAIQFVKNRLFIGDSQDCPVIEGVPESNLSPSETGTVTLISETPNRLQFTTSAATSGWFVLRDTFYPGWKAFINDAEVSIQHADYLFRAVYVPSGTNRIDFVYNPDSFSTGLWISGLCWGTIGTLWLFLRKKRHFT